MRKSFQSALGVLALTFVIGPAGGQEIERYTKVAHRLVELINAAEYPAILGNNAAGFPHVFIGTARPLDLWLFRVHGRLVWGRLSQSAFSPETASAGIRFMAGLVGVVTSRWVPGLELGLCRFSHTLWPEHGVTLSDLLSPLHSRNRLNLEGKTLDNQLASAFARWVFPHSGVEIYGEYGREDYNADLRDFIDEPDHIGGYMASVGFRKAFLSSDTRLLVISAEIQNNTCPNSSHRMPWRGQGRVMAMPYPPMITRSTPGRVNTQSASATVRPVAVHPLHVPG